MSKHTRTKIPEGVTRVINAATGETVHRSFSRSQFATNEALYKAKAEYYQLYSLTLEANESLLEVEVLLKAKRISDLEAQLHGTRNHVTEVNQDG